MTQPRSALARFAPSMREPDDAHARAAARQAYHDEGIVLINLRWLGWADRKQLSLLADKVHGKPKGANF